MMPEDLYHHLSKSLLPLLHHAVGEKIFPAASLGLSVLRENSRLRFFLYSGSSTYSGCGQEPRIDQRTFFDLASLTKPLATTLMVQQLVAAGKVHLDDPLSIMLEREVPFSKSHITLRHLLCHASGFAAYQPYFKKLAGIVPEQRGKELLHWILAEPLAYRTGEKAVYSDLGFLLLGFLIEKKTGKPLDVAVKSHLMRPLGLDGDIFFHRLSKARKEDFFVATEECPWRKKTLCGEVHDDNAFCLDGVAGHAGLFGNTAGVLALTEHLLDCWRGKENTAGLNNRLLQCFLTRQKDIPGSTWALGFDTPNEENASCGRYFSPLSVGHLGFTGTSFWIDPERAMSVVLLTNRVHPHRENTKIRQFRPYFHDRIMESLGFC